MSRIVTVNEDRLSPQPGEEWRGRTARSELGESPRSSSGLLLAGLVAAGLGALAWYYLGPDLRRYLKIRNM
jgi:hypothetical protein